MEPAKLDDRELGCIDFFLFCCLLSSGLVWPTSWAILAPSWAILGLSWPTLASQKSPQTYGLIPSLSQTPQNHKTPKKNPYKSTTLRVFFCCTLISPNMAFLRFFLLFALIRVPQKTPKGPPRVRRPISSRHTTCCVAQRHKKTLQPYLYTKNVRV